MLVHKILKHVATLGFVGYIPVAPGTFGTLVAFVSFMLLKPSILVQVLILLVVLPAGIIAAHIAERALNEKDSRHIIIDEFYGYFLSVMFLPSTFGYALAAFFLFRIFDILKPFPVRNMENLRGGIGIMADDIMAALYTNVLLQVWIFTH